MTKNNQKTYERPTLQVLFVETESVMATSTRYNPQGLQDFGYSNDIEDQSNDWR